MKETIKKLFYEARFGLLGLSIPVIIVPFIATVTWKFWLGEFCVFLFIMFMGFLAQKYGK